MSDSAQTAEAERRLEEALASSGARDPRAFYRERLRELKEASPEGYAQAVTYYRETLIPSIASGAREPLEAWTEYGRTLASALAPGRTISVDATGRARPYERATQEDLILQIPEARGGRAVLIGLPVDPSPAQRATYVVLVEGKQRLG